MRPNQPSPQDQAARARLISGVLIVAAAAIGIESSPIASRVADKGYRLTAIVARSAGPATDSLVASGGALIGAVATLLLLLGLNCRSACPGRAAIPALGAQRSCDARRPTIQTRRTLSSVHFGGLYGP